LPYCSGGIGRSLKSTCCNSYKWALSNSHTIPNSFIYGDVNGNGSIESTDCVWVKRYLLKQIDSFPNENGARAADVNGNAQ